MIRRFLHLISRLTGRQKPSSIAAHPKPGHPATPADHPRHRRPLSHLGGAQPAESAPTRDALSGGRPPRRTDGGDAPRPPRHRSATDAGGRGSDFRPHHATDELTAGPGRREEERDGSRPRQRGGPRKPPQSSGREAGGQPVTRTAPHDAAPWDPATFAVPVEAGKTRFQDLDLEPVLLHAIADQNFLYCTPIQAQALPIALAGHDLAGRAQTGTGKTAAFLLAMFNRFLRQPAPANRPAGTPRALVLAPTRELVVQLAKDANSLSTHTSLSCLAVFGGLGFDEQLAKLGGNVDLVAATPGRLIDFVRRGNIDLSMVEVLVLDEADRMLDMGFIPDVRRIIARLPHKAHRQTLLFSATLSPEILRLAAQWQNNPATVEIEPESVAADTVEQTVYSVAAREKCVLLANLLQSPDWYRVLVFANRRDACERLHSFLTKAGIQAGLLTGDVEQGKRMKILEAFREGRLRVVVATDVAGRGIHIADVSHVVNYDIPHEVEDYVHRIGRTGRAGHAGKAVTFACEHGAFTLPDIEKFIGKTLPCCQPDEQLLRWPPTAKHAAAAPVAVVAAQ